MLTQRPSRAEDRVETGAPASPLPRRPFNEGIDVRVALAVGIAWFVLTAIAAALEPTPQDAEPALAALLGYAMDVVFVAMLIGLAMRRRWGLVTSLAGAVFVTALAVACPTSGHHQFGLWWFGEMACVIALVVGSVVALCLPAPAADQRS